MQSARLSCYVPTDTVEHDFRLVNQSLAQRLEHDKRVSGSSPEEQLTGLYQMKRLLRVLGDGIL